MQRKADYLAGAAAGVIAGLIGAYVMERAQERLKPLVPRRLGGRAIPATERAADVAAEAVTGEPMPLAARPAAGRVIHYATGAALGLVYGVVAERFQAITSAFGLSFGTGIAVSVDESLLPALGLAPPVAKTLPGEHIYSLASHMAFGMSMEGARRLLRGG